MQYSTPELLSYIREQLAAGFTRPVLHSTLEQAGWSQAAIDEAFMIIVAEEKNPVVSVQTQIPDNIPPLVETAQSQAQQPATTAGVLDSMLDIPVSQDSGVSHTFLPADNQTSLQSPTISEYQQPTTPSLDHSFQMSGAEINTSSEGSLQETLPRDSLEHMNNLAKPYIQKHVYHWWQFVILGILVIVILFLMLLILKALNVYDVISINTPAWIDASSRWVQVLFSK
ncbi:hypothetical protein H6776_02705 [Candidatus Nomurabacteria bacterium]|nr:hypothetical protein [Candidatus Nomurabacteria bacterium]